jgi:hypothetical protein
MSYAHSATGRAVLESLVPVICPPEACAIASDIVAHMALTIDASPVIIQKGFAAGLVAYDAGAVPRYGRRASKLVGDKAERYFASWEHGLTPLQRQLARAINQLMSLSCYEMPAMMERVGFRPAPWIEEVRERRLTVYRDDARRQETQILAPDPLRPGVRIGAKKARVG